LEPPHLPPLGGQDCNLSLLPTLWWLVGAVAAWLLAVAAVLAATEQAQQL
jgi:hypothetical protein